MPFCTKCGTELKQEAKFCVSCGAPTNASAGAPANTQTPPPSQPQPTPGSRHLHCPQCRSTRISPINETTISSSVSVGRNNLRSTHHSNIHRNYWMCSDCGTKFRHLQNLEEEIVKSQKAIKVYWIMAVISWLLFVVFAAQVAGNSFMMMVCAYPMLVTLVCGLVFTICPLVGKSKVKKMKEEYQYLSVNCFN